MRQSIVTKGRTVNGLHILSAIALAVLLLACTGTTPGFRWTGRDGTPLAFTNRLRLKADEAALFGKTHQQDVFSLKKGYLTRDASSLAVRVHSESGGAILGLGWTGGDRKEASIARFSLTPGNTTFYLGLGNPAEIKTLVVKLEATAGELAQNVVRIESVAFEPGFTGYEKNADGARISDGIEIQDNAKGSSTWTLHPLSVGNEGLLTIRYSRLPGAEITARMGDGQPLRFGSVPGPRTINVPLGFFRSSEKQGNISVTVPALAGIEALHIQQLIEPKALEGLSIDPGLLIFSPELPAADDFAWYRWDLLPDVIMIDFKSYEIQDKYLKRLAFFVEKKGFVGRLAPDSEILALHGWNAHDYKTEDLARFFTLAAKSGFALGPEEERLRDFLVDKKLISRSGKEFKPLNGAMISISKESPDYLRRTFLTHELSHAIFFSDEGYRQFSMDLWENMDAEEKWFWKLYFGWMNYNTGSSYLMANEMQAYLVQQSLPQVNEYFTQVLVERLLENHKELEQPIAIYMEKFAFTFESRARQIDAWLKAKYGFGAGRLYFAR